MIPQFIAEVPVAIGAEGESRLTQALAAAGAGAFEIDFRKRAVWCSPEFIQIVDFKRVITSRDSVPEPLGLEPCP